MACPVHCAAVEIPVEAVFMNYALVVVVCLSLVGCGGGGSSSAPAPAAVTVVGSLSPDCSGTSCGALNATMYSGSGIGVWRYNNTSGFTASVNVDIGGVLAGHAATLIFSNGSATLASAPSKGTLASPVTLSPGAPDGGIVARQSAARFDQNQGGDDAHAWMVEKNHALASRLRPGPSVRRAAGEQAAASLTVARPILFSPAVGATRSWIDNFPQTPVSYATTAQFVCPLPGGRNVVWWVDPSIVSSGKFTPVEWSAALAAMQTSYCATNGGMDRIKTLLGDVWGPAAAAFSELISDSPTVLQDINVVLLNVPAGTGWAGYFYGGNNFLKSSDVNSNEALAFFINADQVRSDLNFATSTLLHESTHMVNFYQRAVARGFQHDTWLEETSAIMTEDIVAPVVIGGYNKVTGYRLPIYLGTGGNVSYINWPNLVDSSPNYALAGGFGAFLNRRYGLAIYQQLPGCNDGSSIVGAAPVQTSYACLDGLIKANGGSGFSDEFARFGATVFAQLPAVGVPAGYGYPARTTGAYTLQAKDLTGVSLGAAAPLVSGYRASSQTYQRDVVAAGKTRYVRNGVVVPANTTLTVVIK